MPLTRLDNLISSKTGKYLYVSPDDFNATDALSNRGNSPVTPFKSIQRAFIEIARYSYLPGFGNDRFDQFSIMLMPGIHYIDNRPGLVDTSGITEFGFDTATNAWTDDSILDLSNPDNIYYKFNNTEGGAIIPRGSSLVGYDLRRTVVRPLFVPDPAVTEREIPRSAMFNVTGGCYFWQFTLKDGQTTSESPLYDAAAGTGKVYYDPNDFTKLAAPNYSHHKLTVFEYADTEELGLFYRKIAKAFAGFQPTIDDPGEFDTRVQENRIVGPLSDSRVIESLKITDATTDSSISASTSEIEVTTKVDHGYFQGQFVAIANTEIDDVLEGIFQIKRIDQNDARKFTYEVPFVASAIGTNINSGKTVSVDSTPALGQNAQTLAEVDSVESASPYVFNVSIRSTWGICGIWANGLKATGFKSMVIAQYTGVSLQKDDRAFIRYDEYTNTWNQASLVDAFATVPYHTKGDAYYKDEWRNFHVRASEDSFIQCVSIFAVGFADHFLMESGGDMSITNSNSNFGNTSLHAIGFKGFAFNQDKGGYITDIVPPRQVLNNTASTEKINYYTIDIQGTVKTAANYTKLFLGSDEIGSPVSRPAATINGYRIGARSGDKLYVKLDKATGTDEFFNAELEPTGFVKYVAKGDILNPSGGVVNSVYADAANLIESNRRMIQEEVFGYILEKYPRLQNIPYVNPGLNPAGNRYFDARNLITANRQEIVDTAFDDMIRTYGSSVIQGIGDGKCKRDIGLIVDAVAEDLKDGGNANIIAATREYFDGDGNPLTNGLVGEETYATYAFRRARDLCKQAIANLLTVKADLYDPDPNSNLASYGINVGKTGSQAELDGDTTNGVTIDLALKADPASRYKDARNRIVANREFILDASLAEVSVYHPDFYHSVDTQTNSQSRLADAFRLIRRNSSEIRDKALAQIAIDHPNFVIDGDSAVDNGSRYASAYRLISKNRDHIIDTALAQTTVSHPDYFFVGDQQTDARSRYADGYRLIQQNKTEIVNTSWTNTFTQYPAHGAYEAKCKRDLGIFIDAIGLDLFVGGNKYARKFIQEYFNIAGDAWISGGLQGEEAESIYAFNQARDQMGLAVANQLSIQDPTVTEGPAQYAGGGGNISRTNSGACDDVQSAIDTLTDIVTAQITAGNLTGLPAETPYISGPGEEKCRRDIGIFVDSLALDLFCKGNVYTHRFAAEFFTNATTPEFSFNSAVYNTNLNKAADMIKKAITNQLYFKDNGTQGAIDRTADNAPGSDYGQVSKNFTPHGAAYTASTGDMVIDIANHGLSNGDRVKIADNSLTFTCTMDGNTSNKTYPRTTDPVSGQYIEITASTTDSITVNVGASPIVEFTPTTGTTYDPNTGLMVLEIGAHSLTAGTHVKLKEESLVFSCGFGGATGSAAEKAYPRSNGNDPFFNTSIEIQSVTATTITLQVLTTVPSTNTDPHTFVSATTGAVESGGDYTHTFVSAAVDSVNFGGNTENELTDAQPFLCSDVQSAVDSLTSIATTILANGNLSTMPIEVNYGSGRGPGEVKCARDLGYFIDAITVDMYCEGNKHTREYTEQYFTNATTPLPNGLQGEESESITAYNTAINEMKKAITNQLYYKDLTVTEGGSTFAGSQADVGTPTNVTYDATTGTLVTTITGHGLANGDKIKFVENSLTLSCTMDGNTANKTYPRSSDPVFNTWLTVANKTNDTFEVNVGTSPLVTYTAATGTTYDPNTGLMVLEIGNHNLTAGTSIKLAPNSLTFSCGFGGATGAAAEKSYPRAASNDPFYDTAINIESVTTTTITLQVLTTIPSTNTDPHTFVSATAGGVIAGGNYAHTFVEATPNAVKKQNSAITSRTSSSACADVQSAIDTLGTIVTDAIAAGNITGGIWNQAANAGTFITGEAKCRRDLGIVVDAVAQDLWFGGNEFTISATKEYFNGNQLLANGIDVTKEVQPAITAFKRAEDLMQRALNNQYYDRDLNITLDQTGDPPIVGDIECDAHDMVIANQLFIAKEAYERMKAAYPSYTPSEGNTEQDCLDDIYDILREVMWDVKFGGNYKTYSVGKGYITNDFNGKTYPQIIQDIERDEVAKVFQEVKNVAIQVIKNEAVTVSSGNTLTQIIDNTIVEDWDEGELLPKCGSAVAAVDSLMDILIQAIGTDAGVGNLNGIQRTTQDGPDPAWNTALNITGTTATSITVNVGASESQDQYPHTFVSAVAGAVVSGGNYPHTFVSAAANAVNIVGGSQITPSNATYNAVTGDLVMYFGSAHGVTTLNTLSIDNNSLTFSCGMDGNATTKTYPRAGTDPQAGQNMAVQSVTTTSITVNVGTSPLVEHNVSNAVYNTATGDLALTISNHSLTTGTSIKLKEESLIFTCTKDQNKTTHAYPRSAGKYRPAAYADGNCSDVLATVNALVDILAVSLNDGNLNNLPPLNNGEWDCANVRGSIEVLYDILLDAVTGATLGGLPPLNTGDFTINNEASKCFRDVTYIVDAVVNDLRLGGNTNSIQAGEAYYVGNNLEYIDGEKTETLDAWNYVGQMATAAMRNFDVLAYNCSTTAGSAIIDVNDTRGIIIGMSVKEYDDSDPTNPAYVSGLLQDGSTQVVSNIPAGTYVKRIVSNTQVELGVNGSRLTEGNTVNALQTSTTTELYFVYEKGIWADTTPTTVVVGPESEGPDVIQDTLTSASYRECSGTADAIETLVSVITTIINSGLGTVTRSEQTVNTALLASRATIFTIDTGGGVSNPHKFETGTPVRLVPRPRFDTVTSQYVDVDKRLVRLPNGFETNRTYYVIAPGRNTAAGGEDYSGTTFFNGSDQTRLMLATSKENAAAGIYIYASETDGIDKDVEIDIYQFVLDDKYDLHQYTSFFSSTVANGIETEVPHIFDVPTNSLSSTEAQKVFIRPVEGARLPLVANQYLSQNNTNVAITDSSNSEVGRINPSTEFFVRYQNPRTISLHETYADAINNTSPIVFAAGQSSLEFNVFANKRRSPMRYDPTFADAASPDGKWFINCKDEVTGASGGSEKDNIFWRINEDDYSDRQRSTDMWYQRLTDARDKDERTYKIRYVIPKDLENARDPINGFVLKTRTDDTRKLVPQKVLLKPVVGNVYGARFENPVQSGENIGWTEKQIKDAGLSISSAYDPYKKDQSGSGVEYRSFARFASGIQASIQSGRYVEDTLDPTIKYLELTLFDHAVDTKNFPGLRNETFTTVKITAPQGGIFVTSKTDNLAGDPNAVSFAGNSSGLANIHAYYSVGGDYYLIIKNIRGGTLEYSEYANTRFTQGNVFADMLEDQDMGKSLPLKTQIAKNNPQFFYKQNGANVYTVTPGDRIQDDAGVEYYVDSVEDVGVIEDTFYIFGYETLQQRISGQQDGIYYVTALRGNISPFPTGAGITNNFKKFKFSQPVGKLYPLNFRNDPLWFKNSGTTVEEKAYYASLIDPPATYSAADNYVHGSVTVNDFKNSTTKEMVLDLTEQPAFANNDYTNTTVDAGGSIIDNRIQAKDGNATSGSEDRLVPISGDNQVYTDQKYYVELRRPSIARAGNHTFEYLGFGPGNYSTGLPARQEVVLTPDEDFYAQSKKQDGGIVFYTGINSQGDLYIGNRRINAITGEETFIDRATLDDDGDEDDTIGGLVTTFDTPVTFNQNITIVGGDGELVNSIESPILISVQDGDFIQQKDSLIIRSNVDSTENNLGQVEQDEGLDRVQFVPADAGDITLSKNRIRSAIFQFNARGNGQRYMFQTHTVDGIASNITPNMSPLVANGGSTLNIAQTITYGGVLPYPGDVLLKGSEVGKNGSLGWILSNYFEVISETQIKQLQTFGTNIIKVEFEQNGVGIAVKDIGGGITASSQIRVKNYYLDTRLNLTWTVYNNPNDPFVNTNTYVYFQVSNQLAADIQVWSDVVAGTAVGSEVPTIEFSNSNFKEVGVLGAEALRTGSETIGDYKLGINTVARAPHSAYTNAWVHPDADPRANLDVVGTAFISGKTTADFLDHSQFADRDKTDVDNAFLVGGDSANPNDEAVLRVATTNSGRVGINVTNTELDRALVVDGTSRFTDDAKFEHDIEVNGDDGALAEIRTSQTIGQFNLLNDSTFVGGDNTAGLHIGGYAKTIRIGDYNTSSTQWIYVGDKSTGDQFIYIANNANHNNIFLGNIAQNAAISKTKIGGAYDRVESLSYVDFEVKRTKFAGDVTFGSFKQLGGDRTNPEQVVTLSTEAGIVSFFSGNTQTIDFAVNASEVNIAGQGGTTTIRNSLEVDGETTFNSSVKLCGGTSSFSFVGVGQSLGTTGIAHASGILGPSTFNQNVDIVNVLQLVASDPNYNRIDTAGSASWGDATFQDIKTGAGPEGADLPALSGKQYYLPLLNAPGTYFAEGDYLLLDAPVDIGTGTRPEIVRIAVGGLTGAESSPYYLTVEREPLGSFAPQTDNHPENPTNRTPVYKCNIAFDATWIEQAIDGSRDVTNEENVYLSTFGGTLQVGVDYVIVSREDTNTDGDFNQGEAFKLATPLAIVNKKFEITNGCPSGDVLFSVDSVTGDTIIGNDGVDGENGKLTVNGSFEFKGGCKTSSTQTFVGNAQATLNTITAVPSVEGLEVGDYVELTGNGGTVTLEQNRFPTDSGTVRLTDPQIVSIVGSTITLNVPFTGSGSGTGITFSASKDEKFRITDRVRDIFTIDGCSGDTVIGNPSGIVLANRSQYGTSVASHTAGATVYTALKDPKVDNGIATTFVNTVSTITTGATTLPVDDITNFENGDLIFVGFASGGNEEIMQISGTPTSSGVAPAGNLPVTRVGSLSNVPGTATTHSDGETVFRIILRETTLLTSDIAGSGSNSVEIGMKNSDVVPFFLDREYWIFIDDEIFLVTSSNTNDGGTVLVKKDYHHGRLDVYDDVKFIGSNFEITGTDNNVPILKLLNNEEHHFEGGALDINAATDISGNLRLFPSKCIEDPDAIQFTNKSFTPTFRVESEFGDTFVGRLLEVAGIAGTNPTNSQPILDVKNLGVNGANSFTIMQDGSIDAYSYKGYKNKNGGHITKFLNSTSTLSVNINYIIAVAPSTGALILTLPTNPETGDVIRFTEVAGALTYNNSLVIRAPIVGGEPVALQGDTSGTKLGGLSTPYGSGELIVQNRNASFGLIYVGQTDGDNFIPAVYQGWWLTEL